MTSKTKIQLLYKNSSVQYQKEPSKCLVSKLFAYYFKLMYLSIRNIEWYLKHVWKWIILTLSLPEILYSFLSNQKIFPATEKTRPTQTTKSYYIAKIRTTRIVKIKYNETKKAHNTTHKRDWNYRWENAMVLWSILTEVIWQQNVIEINIAWRNELMCL